MKVKGSHLIITLTKAAPDFLARMAMPFFCAIPTNLAHDPNGVLAPPSAGPYYIADRVPNKSITIKKNPNYKGKRPHNVNAINYNVGNSLDATYLRAQQGATDYAAQWHPARVVCRGCSEVRHQQGPVLGQAAARRLLPRVQPRPPALQGRGRHGAREGRQLRDRPQGDARAGRLPRRQADRPDPAPGHRRLP